MVTVVNSLHSSSPFSNHIKMRTIWSCILHFSSHRLLVHCILIQLLSTTLIWSSNIDTSSYSIPNSVPSSPPSSHSPPVSPDFSQCNQLSPSPQPISDDTSSHSDQSSKLSRPSPESNSFPKPPSISSKSLLPSSHSHELQLANNAQSKSITDFDCKQLDFCDDLPGFEAIFYLHRQLDEDDNGDIDISESDEFLRDELKYENGAERQKAFHGNDKHITVDELWRTWKMSPVHNWSVDQTIDWLCNVVELPKYLDKFQLNSVNGIALPRLASNPQFFNVLGINNPIHKQKIALKAMDVVLFGTPKPNTLKKDIFMCVLLTFALAVGWYAFVQHKYSQTHLRKMMKDMEALSSAEKQLEFLQVELNRTKQEHENAFREKRDLERKLKENEIQQQIILASNSSNGDGKVVEARKASVDDTHQLIVNELQHELMLTQTELKRLEQAYSSRQWFAPLQLQQYLQLTYEIEIKNYNAKKAAAEMQLSAAREGCDKLKKKRSTLLGAFRMAHGSSIDFVDNTILQARNLMTELTNEMQERIKRWKQIEAFCGFDIIHNPGFAALENKLYGTAIKTSAISSTTSTTSTTVGVPKNFAYNRTSSSATLVEEDSLSMKSVPTYISSNSSAHGPIMLPNTSYMNFTQQYSPISNIRSPSEDENGLFFANDANVPYRQRVSMENTSLTYASSSGLPVASMPVYNESSTSAIFRPKTLAYSSVAPSQRSRMNIGNFRRGSSDGVEKHFEELNSQSSTLTLTSQSDNSISSNFNMIETGSAQLSNHNHESNDDIASSSSSESAYTLNSTTSRSNNNNYYDNGPDLNQNVCTLASNANTSPSSSAPKKSKAFFGMRKRKTSKPHK